MRVPEKKFLFKVAAQKKNKRTVITITADVSHGFRRRRVRTPEHNGSIEKACNSFFGHVNKTQRPSQDTGCTVALAQYADTVETPWRTPQKPQ